MPSFNCKWPTCLNILKARGYCSQHLHLASVYTETQRDYDQHRRDPEAKRFYDSAEWEKSRRYWLANHPMCQSCGRKLATEVHHQAGWRVDPHGQLMSVCKPCHSRITARERGKK